LNLTLAAILVVPLRQGGLGIANTVTSICNLLLLLFALTKKMGKLELQPVRTATLWLLWLAILAGIIAFMGWNFWEEKLGHATVALRIGAVFVPAIAAALLYWLAAIALKIPAAAEIFAFAAGRIRRSTR